MTKKVAIYTRVSTTNQAEEGFSIDEQIDRLTKYAEAMGAKGYRAHSKEELAEILKSIPDTTGPVVIDVPLDYSDNIKLAEKLLPEEFY